MRIKVILINFLNYKFNSNVYLCDLNILDDFQTHTIWKGGYIINILIFALAATIPWLDLFVALLGSVKMSVLSVMAPALIDTASNWKDLGGWNYKAWKNGLIFVFGLLGMIFGTYVSLKQIIQNFMDHA